MKPIRGLHLIRSASHHVGDGASSDPDALVRLREDHCSKRDLDIPDDGRLATLEVEFSRFGEWYEINSSWEGRFLERVQRGAFKNTIARHRDRVKVFFNHGFDPTIGNKVLGRPEIIEERATSPYLRAGLFDTSYNRDLLPGLREGVYGSSFMFEVASDGDTWDYEPERSEHNPEGLPERTVTAVSLYEAGPVTWPANDKSTSSVRSGADWFMENLRSRDAEMYDELARCMRAFRAGHGLCRADEAPAPPLPQPNPEALVAETSSARHVDGSAASRRQRLAQLGRAVDTSGTRRKVPTH